MRRRPAAGGRGGGGGATHVRREVASLGTQGTRVSPNGPGARGVGSPQVTGPQAQGCLSPGPRQGPLMPLVPRNLLADQSAIGADASCRAQGRGQNKVPSPALETFLPRTGSTPSSVACFRPLPPRPHTLVTAWDPVSPPDGRCLAASWVWLRPARHLQYPVHGCFWFCGNPRLSSRLSANIAAWRGPFPVAPPPPWTDLPHPDPKTPCAFPTAWMTSALCAHGPFPVTLTMFPSTAAVHVPFGLQASGSPASVAPVARGPPVPGPWTVPPRRACLRRSLGSDRLLSPFSPSRLIALDREEEWLVAKN